MPVEKNSKFEGPKGGWTLTREWVSEKTPITPNGSPIATRTESLVRR